MFPTTIPRIWTPPSSRRDIATVLTAAMDMSRLRRRFVTVSEMKYPTLTEAS
jgi:hypothetical protein